MVALMSSTTTSSPALDLPADARSRRLAHTPWTSRQVIGRLQTEWEHLSTSRSAIDAARAWPLPVQHFDTLDDLLRAAGLGRTAAGDADDDLLGALVSLAAGDVLAARVVLQRLLPGIVAIGRRRAAGLDRTALIDDLLATAWTVIRTFPVDRRPRFVAVNLLRDVEYRGYRQPLRRRRAPMAVPDHLLDQKRLTRVADHSTNDPANNPANDPANGVTNGMTARQELDDLLLLAEQAGLGDADLALARRLGRGDTPAQVAADLEVTDRTIRNHRRQVVHRLRAIARTAG